MVLHGAYELMLSDPDRYCESWSCGYAGSASSAGGGGGSTALDNNVALLVDAMSLLKYLLSQQRDGGLRGQRSLDNSEALSPAYIYDVVYDYVIDLVKVVRNNNNNGGNGGGRSGCVCFFFDGICLARDASAAERDRWRKRAMDGDRLAYDCVGSSSSTAVVTNSMKTTIADTQFMHHLAEYAYVEALEKIRSSISTIQQQQQRFQSIHHHHGGGGANNHNDNNYDILQIHRHREQLAGSCINEWIKRNSYTGRYHKVGIISDDTDFLVYEHCDGFILPFSIRIKRHVNNGTCQLTGDKYCRQKLIHAFMPNSSRLFQQKPDGLLMITAAAISGCDFYIARTLDAQLYVMRRFMLKDGDEINIDDVTNSTDISNPVDNNSTKKMEDKAKSKLLIFTSVFEYICTYYEKFRGEGWLDALLLDICSKAKMKILGAKQAIDCIYRIYNIPQIGSQQQQQHLHQISQSMINIGPASTFVNPGLVEVFRLLQQGVCYFQPLVETYTPTDVPITNRNQGSTGSGSTGSTGTSSVISRKRDRESLLEHCEIIDTGSYAIVPLPPLTTQFEAWLDDRGTSLWRIPHFCQVRCRLYCLIRITIQLRRKSLPNIPFGKNWTHKNPHITEYVRVARGEYAQFAGHTMGVPHHDYLSIGFNPLHVKDDAEILLDYAFMFCIMGTCKNFLLARNDKVQKHRTIFLASLLLPFNLACLLILLATAPTNLDHITNTLPATSSSSSSSSSEEDVLSEVVLILPLLTVACHHALLLENTISFLYETDNTTTNTTNQPSLSVFNSTMLRLKNVVCLWGTIRLGRNLENLPYHGNFVPEDMENIACYVDDAFNMLKNNTAASSPPNPRWEQELRIWQSEAQALWVVWWEFFSLDHVHKDV